MIYTTKELLSNGETEYSIRQKLKQSSLYLVERGFYSDKKDEVINSEVFISKKYPNAIITNLSAFYLYGLTDYIPDYHYLATEQHSFSIRNSNVKQSYQEASFFEVGVTNLEINEGCVKTYDRERLLIELFRLKEKYPAEIYYDVLNSFRKIKGDLDFYKVNSYLKLFKNGNNILKKIKDCI